MNKYTLGFLVLFTFASSCKDGNREATPVSYAEKDAYSAAEMESPQNEEAPVSPQAGEAPTEISRQIIYTAAYRIQVDDLEKSTERVKALVSQYKGYTTEVSQNEGSYERTTRMTIRVPADQLEPCLNDIGQDAVYTNYRNLTAQDVTEEFVDIETRLATKKEVRDRYVDILRNKAKTVEEVLNAEEKIRVLQEEIEAQEGRLRYLRSQVSMSTINLEMYQRIAYRPEPGTYQTSFWTRMGNSLANGWELIQDLFLGLVTIWPLLVLGAIGLVWWRRRRAKQRMS